MAEGMYLTPARLQCTADVLGKDVDAPADSNASCPKRISDSTDVQRNVRHNVSHVVRVQIRGIRNAVQPQHVCTPAIICT